jgi:hypothetical protein
VRAKRTLWLLLLAGQLVLAGCSFSSRQPPLPRRAAVEPGEADETFARLTESADIIYFPVEAALAGSKSGALGKLLEALQRDRGSFALGWDPAVGDEKTHRVLLNEASKTGAQVLSLKVPAEVLAAEAAPDFVPPPQDFERFARHLSARGLKEPALRAEYKAALIRQQYVADKIASYFREHRSEKMLLFLRGAEVSGDYGVPYFVAAKTKARQLILNPERHSDSGRGLLAGWGRRLLSGGLEIVDGAPVTARDLF